MNTKIIRTDFSQGFSVYKNLEKELDDVPVGILGRFLNNQYDVIF